MEYSFEAHKIIGGIGADDEYWRSLENNEFRLPQCAKCGKWTWPAHFRCGDCGSWDFNWVKLEPEGNIFSWTRSWYAFDRVRERTEDIPYITVLTEIPEADNARILGVLKGDDTGIQIGLPVRGSIEPPSEKTKFYPSITWEIIR